LATLDEEVQSDPNVAMLEEIIKSTDRSSGLMQDAIDELPPLVRGLFFLFRDIGKVTRSQWVKPLRL
jgi:hypothetical protein